MPSRFCLLSPCLRPRAAFDWHKLEQKKNIWQRRRHRVLSVMAKRYKRAPTWLMLIVGISWRGEDNGQSGDCIWIKGERRSLVVPLDFLFDAMPTRPRFEIQSSANWRGYRSTWRIKENWL